MTTSQHIVQEALQYKCQMAASSLVNNIPFKIIGPIIIGHVLALDVNPENPIDFYASKPKAYTAKTKRT